MIVFPEWRRFLTLLNQCECACLLILQGSLRLNLKLFANRGGGGQWGLFLTPALRYKLWISGGSFWHFGFGLGVLFVTLGDLSPPGKIQFCLPLPPGNIPGVWAKKIGTPMTPLKFECVSCLHSQQQQQQQTKSITLHHCPRHMCISLQARQN